MCSDIRGGHAEKVCGGSGTTGVAPPLGVPAWQYDKDGNAGER